MRRVAALALAAAVACGGDTSAGVASVVSQTADNLAEIRSGKLDVKVDATAGDGRGFGFTISGPFAFDGQKPLPVLDVTYVQRAGAKTTETAVVSTGTEAFVEIGGTAYRVPESELKGIGGEAGLGGLRIDRWLVDPVLEEGTETDTIRAKLDPANVLNDLSVIAARVGQSSVFPRIEGEDAERLRAAGRGSSAVLTTGHDDRVLRRIELTIRLDAANKDALPLPLRSLAPVTLAMTLELAEPNQPVSVSPPASWKPYSEIEGSAP